MNGISMILACVCVFVLPYISAMDDAGTSQAAASVSTDLPSAAPQAKVSRQDAASRVVLPAHVTSPALSRELVPAQHHHSGSVRLSVTLPDMSKVEHGQDDGAGEGTVGVEQRTGKRASVKIQPIEMNEVSTHTQAVAPAVTTDVPHQPDEVVIQVDVPDLAHASLEELTSIAGELVQQARLAVFGTHDENPAYMEGLKMQVLEAFVEYIRSGSPSDSSSTSSSESDKIKHSSLPQDDQIMSLRNSIFQRASSKYLVKTPPARQYEPSASTHRPVKIDKETRKQLKRWFLRELEIYELRMKEQTRQLQDRVSEKERESIEEQRKTKYAILATITTTVCGIASTAAAYFLTHASQASE
jgi:hypothetical protein